MFTLEQTDRAAMQFLGSLQYFSSSELRAQAREDFNSQVEADSLKKEFKTAADEQEWDKRISRARKVAQRSESYRLERFFQRYVGEHCYIRGIPATERKRPLWENWLNNTPTGDQSHLQLNENLTQPDYCADVEWHLEPGGYDGYDLQGPLFISAIGPHVFSRGGFAAVAAGADIQQQRVEVINQFRNPEMKRIYDLGCGGAMTLSIIRKKFPQAELVGGDLCADLLTAGHMASEAMGLGIVFRQEDARATAESDNSCDGVISYAVHHEMPKQVTKDTIAEMFRILAPGGEMVISDPPPFRAVEPFQAVLLEWEKDNRVEPYFAEFCATDLADLMRSAGFIDVEEYPLDDSNYPWITRGRKPA